MRPRLRLQMREAGRWSSPRRSGIRFVTSGATAGANQRELIFKMLKRISLYSLQTDGTLTLIEKGHHSVELRALIRTTP